MTEISVIVPVYNVQKYLTKLVSSVREQTFEDWELILVDDGSTDNVSAVIEEFRQMDSRIKPIIRSQNGGAAQARKSGLAAAKGQYVCFFDADDWIENDMLQTMFRVAKDTQADIVCCAYYTENKGKSKRIHFEQRMQTEYSGKNAIQQLLRRKNVLPHPWNKLFRKEVLQDDYFLDKKAMGEDYVMVLGALYSSSKVVQIDQPLYHYMLRQGSTLDVGFNEFYQNGFDNYREVQDKLTQHFPTYQEDIICYHSAEEMAIMVSMFKNSKYDDEILQQIIRDVRQNLNAILRNRYIQFRFRISALIICVNYRILRTGYMVLYHFRSKRKM